MRERRKVILDAQFGKDIVWLRDEFRPSVYGTREKVFVPVKVVAPGKGEVTLLIYAHDLYVLGWRTNDGDEFHLSDHPDGTSEKSLKFSSHYSDLNGFAGSPITVHGVYEAVRALGSAKTTAKANDLASQVGLMALTISEALRQDVVAGLMESLFAHRQKGGVIERSLIKHYANNYSKNIKQGDPYVELPLQ